MWHQAGSIKIYDCSSVNMTILMFSDVLIWNTHRHTLWLSCLSKQFASAVVQAYHWESVELMSVKNWRKVGLPHFFLPPSLFLHSLTLTCLYNLHKGQAGIPNVTASVCTCVLNVFRMCEWVCVSTVYTESSNVTDTTFFVFVQERIMFANLLDVEETTSSITLSCSCRYSIFFLLFYMCVKETADDSLFL